jgi:serine/threonine protein kinase
MLFKDITSGKKLKSIDDKELNDLMNHLLQINTNKRISWDEYFNHSFFKSDNLDNKNLLFLILNVKYILKIITLIIKIVN